MIKLSPHFKRKFAVVKLWPTLKTAEHEVAERLKISAQTLGVECVEITPNGFCINSKKPISSKDVDFAIHLHFDTPKNYDIFSFVALWNPIDFFFDFGYARCCKNLVSHDDFLSCNSTGADDHIKRLLIKQPLHLNPEFTMFHSLSDPIFQPTSKERNLFYIGINWEKLAKGRSRHQELLKKLDRTDYFRIYGPNVIRGIKVWKDYKSYVGEIPFDGKAVIQALHAEGVGLVLSSDAHREAEMMSNRLFEAAAAGAVIICDDNPFAKKYFKDSLLYIDSSSDDAFSQTHQHMLWINSNPEAAKELAIKSQNIFLQNFLLSNSLASIYNRIESRKKDLFFNLDPTNGNNPKIALVYILTDAKSEIKLRSIESCLQQDYRNLHLIIAVDAINPEATDSIELKLNQAQISYQILPINSLNKNYFTKLGSSVTEILQRIQGVEFEYFNIVLSHEEIFHNHISSLVRISEQNKNGIAVTSSVSWEDNRISYETQSEYHFDEYDQIPPNTSFARFLLPRSVIQEKFFCFLRYLNKKFCIAFIGLFRNSITSSGLVTVRINHSAEYFKSNLTNRLEKQLINEILESKSARPIDKIKREGTIIAILEQLKPFIQKISMPEWLRTKLGQIYSKIKFK